MKPKHKQKIDELISELSQDNLRESNLIASVLCTLMAAILTHDMEDFGHWTGFYNKNVINQRPIRREA